LEPTPGASATALRVALVCPYSLSRPGGVQGQVLGLARTLCERGHQATVFAPVDGPVAPPPGVCLVATGRSVSLPGNGSLAPVTLSVSAVVRAVREVRAGGFDVVHVHEPFAPGVTYGLLVGRGLPPLVGTFHRSGGSPLYTALGPVARRLAERLAARCAVSDAARSTAADALGGTYRVGFNGVEVDRYRDVEPWPTERPALLFLGRHEERKGLQVLLEAFTRLGPESRGDRRVPPAHPVLWIAGDGPETGSLRRLHPESAAIRWLGVIPEEEKERRLAAARLLCAPSLGGESFGMVLLEAMAAGAVVVASDIDGYRDAAGGHAVLVAPGDPSALAGALAGVLSGTLGAAASAGPGGVEVAGGGRRAWLDAAGSWADHWSMGRLARWYEDVYRSVLVGPGGGAAVHCSDHE
jgi:phosphatidylinositol alpha-mannosyltransferase